MPAIRATFLHLERKFPPRDYHLIDGRWHSYEGVPLVCRFNEFRKSCALPPRKRSLEYPFSLSSEYAHHEYAVATISSHASESTADHRRTEPSEKKRHNHGPYLHAASKRYRGRERNHIQSNAAPFTLYDGRKIIFSIRQFAGSEYH